MSNNDFPTPDFEGMARQLMQGLTDDVAVMARDFFRASFDNQGFTDYALITWPLRKDLLAHKILIKSGTLKNSIKIAQATPSQIVIEAGRGIPYAAIHNTGGTIIINLTKKMRKYFWAMYYKTDDVKYKWMAVTPKKQLKIYIPQRQYIGDSEKLLKNIDQYIVNKIKLLQSKM